METYAIHKSAMVAPRKARMTMDLIRGKDIFAARAILDTTNTKSRKKKKKVLESAISNAVNNFDAKESDLFISECMVNPGPVYKRVKFASRGNVDRRDKRTSHIIVRVSDGKGGNN